jgi:hypothetical protein
MHETQFDLERAKDLERVKHHAAMLMEHFDSVQVFVTRHTPDGTVNVNFGCGNFFARYGQTELWVWGQDIHDEPSEDEE